MRWQQFGLTAVVAMGLALVLQADQGRGDTTPPAGAAGQGGGRPGGARAAGPGGGRAGAGTGAPIGGTLALTPVDARGWGWQVKATMNPARSRPTAVSSIEATMPSNQLRKSP